MYERSEKSGGWTHDSALREMRRCRHEARCLFHKLASDDKSADLACTALALAEPVEAALAALERLVAMPFPDDEDLEEACCRAMLCLASYELRREAVRNAIELRAAFLGVDATWPRAFFHRSPFHT